MPLNILYEDDDLLVVDKPAGLTVHPAPGHPGHTLVNAILAHYPRLADISDSLRPGIVHRLDKDTSGVMLVAKNRVAQANLVEPVPDPLRGQGLSGAGQGEADPGERHYRGGHRA